MKLTNLLLILCTTLLTGLILYVVLFNRGQRTAFFYNQKVFDQFEGKQVLESKLNAAAAQNKKRLDSLAALIEGGRTELNDTYQDNLRQSSLDYQQLSEKYTADIWKYINNEVSAYGVENGYDYIFGASGNGSLMYADSVNDITNKIVKYLNEQYK